MRVYADTSFMVKLLTQEQGTQAAVDLYRRLGRPPIFFLPLHALEVANAIRQRAFHQRRTTPSSECAAIKRECNAALSLLDRFISKGAFVEISTDMDVAIDTARALSQKYTENLGCRGFDLFHVALALELDCEEFLTSDRLQGTLARAAGLKVTASIHE